MNEVLKLYALGLVLRLALLEVNFENGFSYFEMKFMFSNLVVVYYGYSNLH